MDFKYSDVKGKNPNDNFLMNYGKFIIKRVIAKEILMQIQKGRTHRIVNYK